jgi:hypothetical protein
MSLTTDTICHRPPTLTSENTSMAGTGLRPEKFIVKCCLTVATEPMMSTSRWPGTSV